MTRKVWLHRFTGQSSQRRRNRRSGITHEETLIAAAALAALAAAGSTTDFKRCQAAPVDGRAWDQAGKAVPVEHQWIRQRQQTALLERQLPFVSERIAALTANPS
jgi:hypothetical protein